MLGQYKFVFQSNFSPLMIALLLSLVFSLAGKESPQEKRIRHPYQFSCSCPLNSVVFSSMKVTEFLWRHPLGLGGYDERKKGSCKNVLILSATHLIVTQSASRCLCLSLTHSLAPSVTLFLSPPPYRKLYYADDSHILIFITHLNLNETKWFHVTV